MWPLTVMRALVQSRLERILERCLRNEDNNRWKLNFQGLSNLRMPISLFTALSPLVSVRFSRRSTSNRHPNPSLGLAILSTTTSPFHPSNQPHYEPSTPIRDALVPTTSSAVTVSVTPSFPFCLVWSTSRYRVCAAAMAFEQS